MAIKIEKKTKRVKKKTKIAAEKKTKTRAKQEVKSVTKKKTKGAADKKIKTAGNKRTKSIVKNKTKSIAGKKVKKSAASKTRIPVVEIPVVEKITHGDDLHLIPVQGEIHPIGTMESHQLENRFHQQEEVAFHQESRKMKEAMSTRKNAKRIFRHSKRR